MKPVKILILALVIPFSVVFAGNDDNKVKSNEINTTMVINGIVMDKHTGEALTGVKVELSGTTEVTYTDFYGNFQFQGLQPGNYKVETSLISYQENTENIQLNSEEVNVSIKLETVNK